MALESRGRACIPQVGVGLGHRQEHVCENSRGKGGAVQVGFQVDSQEGEGVLASSIFTVH